MSTLFLKEQKLMAPRLALVGLLVAGLWLTIFTPAQAQTASLIREEITLELSGGVTTKGEFNYPNTGNGPFPAILLVQGSGVTDRDEGAPEPDGSVSRIFEQISASMNARGIAVFRYDKRGVCKTAKGGAICNPQVFGDKTKELLIEDAKLAYARMIANPRIDRSRTAALGHSEGSLIVPYVASAYPDIQTLILMGTTLSLLDAAYYQTITRPLLGIKLFDDNQNGALDFSEVPLANEQQLLTFIYYTSGYATYLFRFEGSGENINPVGINPKLDKNADGKLDFEAELRPFLEDNFNNFGNELSLIAKYADPSVVSLLQEVYQLLDALEGKWRRSYASEAPDQGLRNLLNLPNRPPALLVNGTYDQLTPLSSVTKLADGLKNAGYPYQLNLYNGLSHFLSPTPNILLPFYPYAAQPQPVLDMSYWASTKLGTPSTLTCPPGFDCRPVAPAVREIPNLTLKEVLLKSFQLKL